jgi:hypothetical protein
VSATDPLNCACSTLRSSAQKTTTLDTGCCKTSVNTSEEAEIKQGTAHESEKTFNTKTLLPQQQIFPHQTRNVSASLRALSMHAKAAPTTEALEPQCSRTKMPAISLHFFLNANETFLRPLFTADRKIRDSHLHALHAWPQGHGSPT